MGHRGNHQYAHQVRQGRRHRRSRPLRGAGSSEWDLQRVGARLRAGRFAEGADLPRQNAQPESGDGAERARGGASTIRPATGIRWPRCRTRASSPGPAPTAMAFRKKCRARPSGSTKCAAAPATPSAPRPRGRSPRALGVFPNSVAAWQRRTKSGQMGPAMSAMLAGFGPRGMAMYADWTDRIAAGEVPEAPPRPQGVERNLVVTLRDWSTPVGFVHDLVSTDKRKPTLNANGPVYSISRFSTPDVNILDTVRNAVTGVDVGVRDKDTNYTNPQKILEPSAYWGEDVIWHGQASLHNPMLDATGRVWLTHAIRASANNPAWCKAGIEQPVRPGVPTPQQRTSALHVRSEDQEGHDDRHVLRHASPAVCRRRQQHAVFQRKRTRGGLVQHESVRRDGGCTEGAGLGLVRDRLPTATASGMRTPSPISRTIAPRTSASAAAVTASSSPRSMGRSGSRWPVGFRPRTRAWTAAPREASCGPCWARTRR